MLIIMLIICLTDSFKFHDMHVIQNILYDSKHHRRWQMTFGLGVIYKRLLISREIMAVSE